jgi:hypothetical protein
MTFSGSVALADRQGAIPQEPFGFGTQTASASSSKAAATVSPGRASTPSS